MKPLSDKKQDIFTQIVLKILEKILGTLPSVIHRLFGNLVSSVGHSYGDSHSPLQHVFDNLGAVGFIPLILIRFLDTAGVILKHLSQNKLFKSFLLPGIIIAAAGVGILFLVYFYQQDEHEHEPYGYIDYHGNDYNKYPQYEANPYSHNSYGATDYGSYQSYPPLPGPLHANYKSNNQIPSFRSYPSRPPLPLHPNYRSNMEIPSNYGDFFGENPRQLPDRSIRGYNPNFDNKLMNSDNGANSLTYSRGYYDYFNDRFRNKNLKR